MLAFGAALSTAVLTTRPIRDYVFALGRLFTLVALVVVGSIVLHSSTDVPIARWFRRDRAAGDNAEVSG